MVTLIALLGTRASADIYIVPPTPVAISLRADQRVLSVNAQAYRAFPAQHAYIQLAVVGTPQFVPTPPPQHLPTLIKPQTEDPTPTPLTAAQTVTQDDLDKARAALVAWGVPSEAITTAAPQPSGGDRVGQVLVSIAPATPPQFARISKDITDAMLRFPQIRPAGTVLAREGCDAQRTVADAALHYAGVRAGLLANAAGFTAGKRIRNDAWYGDASPYRYQLVCGAQRPRMPPYVVWTPELPDRPYQVMENRGVLFALGTSSTRAAANVRFEQTQTPDGVDGVLFAHQFHVPWDEPFVGALGQFEAVMRPDMVVAIFSVTQAPSDEGARRMWAEIDAAIDRAGIDASNIVRSDTAVYARMPSFFTFLSLEKDTTALRARYAKANLRLDGIPMIFDCSAARGAVARGAFAAARARAFAMASVAHVRIGPLFAIDDGGESVQTLCGYTNDSQMSDVVRAIAEKPGNFSGARAVFRSAVAVAWHLDVPPAPRADAGFVSWDAFTTRGTGALGLGTTLQSATLNAFGSLHGSPVQALIDEGAVHGQVYNGPLSERVYAVSGS